MSEQTDAQEGRILLVDKPYEWTSFDVVKKLRNKLGVKKIGHAGTLDPLATGLLILCTNKKTKQIQFIQDEEKEYTGTMVIGETTPSYDLETEVSNKKDIAHITESDLVSAKEKFQGVIAQVPPIYSAIKVKGKRAYESARKNEKVELKPRNIEIKLFEFEEINLPEISFRVICSKGTYIRSLANDLGEELGVGAYLSSLRRVRIGDYSIENAQTIEAIV
ncbi:MAG: tRNA pseudouridine(55) synthase TruB [Bacteroidota bacterium]